MRLLGFCCTDKEGHFFQELVKAAGQAKVSMTCEGVEDKYVGELGLSKLVTWFLLVSTAWHVVG